MNRDLSQYPVWEVDPTMFSIGPVELRWYSFFFFMVFVFGYLLWHWQMLRGGHDPVPVSRILVWGAVGVIAGGRLGHCLFYEPEFYLAHPLEILRLTRGGLSSHGSSAGIALSLVLYSRYYGFSIWECFDRFSFSAMFAGSMVRFGNFFNSEIVGLEWYGPFALRFPRYAAKMQAVWEREHGPLGWTAQALPRHPSQLYEVAGMWTIFAILLLVDRRLGENRPRGMLVALMCTLYFGFRFAIEQLKEFQRFAELAPDATQQVIRVTPSAELTMGQWLSIPWIALFAGVLVYSLTAKLPASVPSRKQPS